MPNTGKLFLIPTVISPGTEDDVVPPQVRKHLLEIADFLAEDIRTARRYLSSLKVYETVDRLSFSVLDKNTKEPELQELFRPVFEGRNLGVLSESGCPGVADPGAIAVRFAHQHSIKVKPLVGPSAILLGLMASGLNGQRFAFHGYLPVRPSEAAKAIRDFEKESRLKSQTQIFIETPYRNNALFAILLKTLQPETQLCLAMDVTGGQEFIKTQPIGQWRSEPLGLPKIPIVFLFLA
jgi:16S rRNA (cytidine1402-2'-O)-methyltransferase